MKKFIILILCITMLISVFPTASFAAGINNVPIIILKMDDYTARSASIEGFEKTFQILQEEGIKASFGIIGRLSEENEEENITQENLEKFWENTREYLGYGIQFWSHGYSHTMTEFEGGLTADEAEVNFKKTLDLFEENTGAEITCFGSPGNNLNQECFAMIDEKFPQITSMFKAGDITESTDEIFVMKNKLNVEVSGSPSFEYFKTNYDSMLGQDYAYIQLHAGGYTGAEREELRKIIDFLQEKGTVFMTPDEYLERRNLAITNVRVMDDGQLQYTIAGTQLIANSSQLQVEIKSAEDDKVIYEDSFTYDGTKYLTLDSDIERDPGKKYILCISIMEDDRRIHSAKYEFYEIVSDSPIIILKLDDLSFTDWIGFEAFKHMYKVIDEEGVTACFGAVGSRLTREGSDFSSQWKQLKGWIDDGIEIWSHGWLHNSSVTPSEFDGYYETEAEMEEAFRNTLDLVKENTGYDITCFGAPGNDISADAVDMINEKFPQITSMFFVKNGTPNAVNMDKRFNTLDGSSFTLDNFQESYNPEMDYAVIQLHPDNFRDLEKNEEGTYVEKYNYVENFREVIRFLKDEGCTFMTPSQYVDYLRLTSSDEAAEITAVAKDNVVVDNNGLGGSVDITIFSEEASDAIVIAAVFAGNKFLTASVTDVALARGTNVETITLPIAWEEDNTSYDAKFYLWQKDSLKPLAQSVAETVKKTPKVWTGNPSETPLTPNSDGYYEISNGEELAWFANYVNAGNTTANAILMDDIYLNGFFEADDVTFDEDWYDTASNLTNAITWKNYMINGYKGTFDGKGHTIYGLYMANGSDSSAGFFNTISTDGTLKNVNFKGAYVVAADSASNKANGFISIVSAQVMGGTIDTVTVGGKIGIAEGKFVNFIGSVTARITTGASTIKNCTSNVYIDLHKMSTTVHGGNISKADSRGLGGIVGCNHIKNTVIENCVNNGEIYAPYYQKIGGIIGNVYAVTAVKNCTNNAKITHAATVGTYGGAGQIVGYNNSNRATITNSKEYGTLVPFTAE